MKKNTFKTQPQDIKYEPIQQPKQSLWMHSVERAHPKHGDKVDASLSMGIIIFCVAALYLTAYLLVS